MRKLSMMAAVLACLAVQPATAQSGDEIGRIKNTTAGVSIIRSGQTYRASSGRRVYEDDTIVTGARARVGITFADNTRMAIGPNSEVVLDDSDIVEIG